MEFRDYYKILGVERSADQKAISAAYRKLARQYHPDINKTRGAEDRFKEINEGYQVLGDAEKRARFDQMYDLHQRGGMDWATLFGGAPRAGRSRTFHVEVGGLGDLGGFSEFFQQFFGDLGADFPSESRQDVWGRDPGTQEVAQAEAPSLEISLEEAFRGVRKPVEIQINGKRQHGEVIIPAGVRSGQRIRLSGAGDHRDLLLTVNVRPHPVFERKENDLYVDVPVTLAEAMLGAKIEVPTLEGKVTMEIPAETQNGQLFRLRGQGMPRVRGGARGDQLVRVKVVLPSRLSSQERELFERLRQTRPENPRAHWGCK